MGIALVIMGGLVLISIFAAGFDFLAKGRTRLDDDTRKKVELLEQKMAELENSTKEKEVRVEQLENDLAFLNRLLEKK